MTARRRNLSAGWVLLGIAGVFAAIALFATIGIARVGIEQLWHPAAVIPIGAPLLLALLIGTWGWRQLHAQPPVLHLDGAGVTLRDRTIPWDALTAVSHRTMLAGYGPLDLVLFHPQDGRPAHIAPRHIDQRVESVLEAVDTALAEQGLSRESTPTRHFRGLWVDKRWVIRA